MFPTKHETSPRQRTRRVVWCLKPNVHIEANAVRQKRATAKPAATNEASSMVAAKAFDRADSGHDLGTLSSFRA